MWSATDVEIGQPSDLNDLSKLHCFECASPYFHQCDRFVSQLICTAWLFGFIRKCPLQGQTGYMQRDKSFSIEFFQKSESRLNRNPFIVFTPLCKLGEFRTCKQVVDSTKCWRANHWRKWHLFENEHGCWTTRSFSLSLTNQHTLLFDCGGQLQRVQVCKFFFQNRVDQSMLFELG